MNVPYESPQRRPRIEIIPLIDVIFFLLATSLMVSLSMVKNQGVSVRLPVASTGQPQAASADHSVTVTVVRNGNLYLNKQSMSFEALHQRLQALYREDPSLRVNLHGDESANFGDVVKALDEMRKLGIERVAMQTTGADSPARSPK